MSLHTGFLQTQVQKLLCEKHLDTRLSTRQRSGGEEGFSLSALRMIRSQEGALWASSAGVTEPLSYTGEKITLNLT